MKVVGVELCGVRGFANCGAKIQDLVEKDYMARWPNTILFLISGNTLAISFNLAN
jgi:hypothetical protein